MSRDLLDELISLNADEWNSNLSNELGLPLSKITSLITYRDLLYKVGEKRLEINRTILTDFGKDKVKLFEESRRDYGKLLDDDYDNNMNLLDDFVVKHENGKSMITALTCTGKIIIGIDFSGSVLTSSYFNQCTFYNCNFTDCEMDGIVFSACNISNCSFNKADFTGGTVMRNTLIGCDFTDANFTYNIINDNVSIDCDFNKCNFMQSRILASGFSECAIIDTSFRDVDMIQVMMSHVEIMESNFKNAAVMDSIFNKVDFSRCNFESFVTSSITETMCKIDEKYKHYFSMDHTTYSPAIFEWEDNPEE